MKTANITPPFLRFLSLLSCICLIGGLSLSGQKLSDQITAESFNSISRREIELMIADAMKTNPSLLKKLADPEARKEQIKNLKQLLAFASQAQKDGMVSDPINQQEMENIRAEIMAVGYDKEVNNGRPAMPRFFLIDDASIRKFWSEANSETEFQRFLDAKLAILRQNDPKMNDSKMSEDELVSARDIFAKIRIYKNRYEKELSLGTLKKELIENTNLKVKLQQAQFLARLFSDKVVDRLTATNQEVEAYLKSHRGLSQKEARSRLEKEKERRLFDELITNNNIRVPDDFTLPTLPVRKDQ